ncbi:tetratricopeptide repeat protein [Microbulbifer taiwanensis]
MDLDSYPIYSHGGLAQIIKHASTPEKRLKAVLSTKQMPEKQAISLLRFALKDPVDDVRLLAYSMLDTKEKSISENIHQHLKVLRNTVSRKRQRILHHLIASNYWELVYLDLAQGGVRRHMLDQAQAHIAKSLEIKRAAPALKLYGRILGEAGKLSESKAMFEAALNEGMAEAEVAPYLAEVAFISGDFHQVEDYLRIYSRSDKQTPTMQPILKYWLT